MIDLTEIFMRYYGVARWNSGADNINRLINAYNQNATLKIPLSSEWCAVAMVQFCKFLNYDIGEANCWVGTWQNLGTTININEAQMGDIVLIGNSANQSHITTFVRLSNDKTHVYCLGGNQNDQINISPFIVSSIFKIIRLTKKQSNS